MSLYFAISNLNSVLNNNVISNETIYNLSLCILNALKTTNYLVTIFLKSHFCLHESINEKDMKLKFIVHLLAKKYLFQIFIPLTKFIVYFFV